MLMSNKEKSTQLTAAELKVNLIRSSSNMSLAKKIINKKMTLHIKLALRFIIEYTQIKD